MSAWVGMPILIDLSVNFEDNRLNVTFECRNCILFSRSRDRYPPSVDYSPSALSASPHELLS